MSLFNFTRQEQITILFLTFALLVGGAVTLVKRHHPGFAPELVLEESIGQSVGDTTLPPERSQGSLFSDSLSVRKVDINRATFEELIGLPGIGPKTARLIIAHRAERGDFRSLEDLKEVRGIGEKTIDRLKAYVKIE